MLTVPEAARRANRDPETIRRWIRAGKLTARKVGTQHLIEEDDLAGYLQGPSRTEQDHEIREAAASYGASASTGRVAPTLDVWLPQVVGRLVRAMDPVRIVLFGERARGEQRPDSDYDLLVILDVVDHHRAARLEIRRLLDDLPISKDVIAAATTEIDDRDGPPWGALYWALQEGKTIYERP